MKALFAKELRQGWPALAFALAAVVLVGGAASLSAGGQPGPLAVSGDVKEVLWGLYAMLVPGLLAALAAARLFAAETERDTTALLLALPLSRGRIWAAKVLAGLAVGVGATVFFVGLAGFALGTLGVAALRTTGLDLAQLVLWWLVLFAMTTLASAAAGRTVSALMGGVAGFAGVMLAATSIVERYGGRLQGYDVVLDIEYWALLWAVAAIAASLAIFRRGELLRAPGRLWRGAAVFAAGGLLLSLGLIGTVRAAVRYQRSAAGYRVLSSFTHDTAGRVLGFARAGSVVLGPPGVQQDGPLFPFLNYRSSHPVVLDPTTGRELLVGPEAQQAAVSPDGTLVAALGPRPALTWRGRLAGTPSYLRAWDLRSRRLLYQGSPLPALECPPDRADELAWSPDNQWLLLEAAPAAWSGGDPPPYSLGLMQPVRSGRELWLYPVARPLRAGHPWAWLPDGRLAFLDAAGRLLCWHPQRGCAGLSRWTERVINAQSGAVRPSPDGRWLATWAQALPPQAPPPSRARARKRPPGHLAVYDMRGGQRLAPGTVTRLSGIRQLAWSTDGRRLYVLHETGRLLRWQPGEGRSAQVPASATEPYTLAVVPRPGTGDLLLWSEQPRLLGSDGTTRPVACRYRRHDYPLCFDRGGRLIILRRDPRDCLVSVGLAQGDERQLYP